MNDWKITCRCFTFESCQKRGGFYLIHLCIYIYIYISNGSVSEDGHNLGPCWEASWLPSCYKEHVSVFGGKFSLGLHGELSTDDFSFLWCVSFPLQELPLKIPGVGDPTGLISGVFWASFCPEKIFHQMWTGHIVWEYDLKWIRSKMIKTWQNLRWSHISFRIHGMVYWPIHVP